MMSNEAKPLHELCGYCGARLGTQVGASQPSYRRCSTCGSLSLRPLPTSEDNGYFNDAGAVERMDATDCRRKDFLAARLDALETANDGATAGLLLDIGCATGRVLQAAAKRGWGIAGVELSPALADRARTLLPGITVQTADVMALDDLPWGECAAVVALDVIEHVMEPAAFAERIHRLLRPGGVAVLHTPNARGLRARLHGERWNMRIPRYHYHLATGAGLRCCGERAGLETVRIRSTSGTGQERGGAARLVFWGKTAVLRGLGLGNGLEVLWRKG